MMKRVPASVIWFLVLLGTALALWAMPFAYAEWGDAGFILYVLSMRVLAPVLGCVLSYHGGKKGLHPMAAFFPVGSCLLFSPHGEHGWLSIGVMCLSLVSCAAGNEMKRRQEQEKTEGKKHGTKKK